MAVTARKNDNYEYAPTRVYSYSRSAVAEAAEPAVKKTKQQVKAEPVRHVKKAVKTKPYILKIAGSMLCIGAAAALMLFVIMRYAAINEEYAGVNKLKTEITQMKQDIEALNVQLNTAVNIEKAREAALNAGLGYPTAEQVVKLNRTGEDVTDTNGD